ncbi:MAG: metallopeptidase TldD-related protein, partial [Promethearchaeota archaeon]
YFIRVFNEIDPSSMGIGVVQLNSTNITQIQKAIQRAEILSKSLTHSSFDLVSPGLHYQNPNVVDLDLWKNPNEFMNQKSLELQEAFKETLRAQVSFGKLRSYKIQKALINSNGFRKNKRSTKFYYEFAFRAKSKETGRMAEYWTSCQVKKRNQLKFLDYFPEWTTMARDALSSSLPPPDPHIDVLFSPEMVRICILETLGYSLTAPAIYTKTSPFQVGDKISVPNLTIIDDGISDSGLHSSSWDSEGFPKQRTILVNEGVIKNILYDSNFAKLMGTKSTGNAQRYPEKGGKMKVEINNLDILPGEQTLQEIFANTVKMVYVNKFQWLHPNPITGDFGATILHGYLVENGKISNPIRGGTISGNIYKMLEDIDGISKETRVVDNAIVPFIKFKNLRFSS